MGAIACFFEQPWRRVSPVLTQADQSWLLGEAALTLHSLGRLTEALETMQACLGMRVNRGYWENAAVAGSNLSALELTAADAKQALTYAESSGAMHQLMINSTVHAEVLHQAGRWDEAAALFREAEEMQAAGQPACPLLHSVHGFQYCDPLLADAERAAWRRMLNLRRCSRS